MKIHTASLADKGLTCFCYGPFGGGKTFSVNTVPGNVLLLNFEPKPPMILPENEHRIILSSYDQEEDDFESIMTFIANALKQYPQTDTIFLDSVTFLQGELRTKIEDSRAKMLAFEKKVTLANLPISSKYQMEWNDWTSITSQMKRLTSLLNNHSKGRVNTIMTGHPDMEAYPIRPKLAGKDFSYYLPGFFDNVGYVIPGKVNPYPPYIYFYCPSGLPQQWVSRSTGRISTPLPLDWELIFRIFREARKTNIPITKDNLIS